MAAGIVHQDLPHELCGHGKKMCTVLPLWKILIDQANVSFVDQSGALQRVARALVLQIVMGDAAQLGVDEGH